jgi:putative membrane protein
MKKASAWFTESDRKALAEDIARAESATTGEIVPVVATTSGNYDRAEDLFGLVFALISLSVYWLLRGVAPFGSKWSSGPAEGLSLPVVLSIVVVAFIVGAVLATAIPSLRTPFIPKSEMGKEVERRAAEAFHRFRIRNTAGATGVLIYVSLFEHAVRVFGDNAINEKVDQKTWQEICDLVVDGIRKGEPAGGLSAGILRCGEVLARHFPIDPGDKNELVNTLHLID